MRHDDEFDGTTYVSHNDSNKVHITSAEDSETEKTNAKRIPLEERVAALEAELSAYKEQVDKKLVIVDKLMSNKHISPAERVFMIQEES